MLRFARDRLRALRATAAAAALLLAASIASAQSAPPVSPGDAPPAPRIATDGRTAQAWLAAGGPMPSGYHVELRRRRLPMALGGAAFGLAYMLSIMRAMEIPAGRFMSAMGCYPPDAPPCRNDYWPLVIPFVGPFVTMGTASSSTAGGFGLAALGLGQLGGTAALIYGLTSRERRLVENEARIRPIVMPFIGRGGTGLAVTGAF